MPNTTGLTSPQRHTLSPRHPHWTAASDATIAVLRPVLGLLLGLGAVIALPIVEWADDLTRSERRVAIAKTVIGIVGAVVLVVVLAACDTGTTDTGPATTGITPTVCEEDQPCWNPCLDGNRRPCTDGDL